jgi:acetyl-CoA synthetase
LPPLSAGTTAALAAVLPANATPANPLDYTAAIFGEVERTTRLVAAAGGDESIGAVLVYYDRPAKLGEAAAAYWDDALAGLVAGAAGLDKPVLLASTLPELMPERTAEDLVDAGIVPVAGLSEGVLCVGALLRAPADAGRLRAVADLAALRPAPGAWLAEHDAKALLRAAGIATPPGEVVDTAAAAVAAAQRLGGAVALKLSAPHIRHKSDIGAVLLDLRDGAAVREAFARLRGLPGQEATPVLVESMSAAGVEVMIAVRRDGLVPVLVVALGGLWVEVLDDAALLPLPVDRATVRRHLDRLRGAPLLAGGRGRPAVDLDALSDLAVTVARLAVDASLELIELNPVFARADGATVVDAVIRRAAP